MTPACFACCQCWEAGQLSREFPGSSGRSLSTLCFKNVDFIYSFSKVYIMYQTNGICIDFREDNDQVGLNLGFSLSATLTSLPYLERGCWDLQADGWKRSALGRACMGSGTVCQSDSDGKESACNAGDLGSTPGSRRIPGEGKSYPLQYSCLENSMDSGAWWATVHGAPKSQTYWVTNNLYFHLTTYLGLPRWLSGK